MMFKKLKALRLKAEGNYRVLERKSLINVIATAAYLRLNMKYNVIEIEKVLIYQLIFNNMCLFYSMAVKV